MDTINPTVSLSTPAEFPDQYASTCLAALRRIWERMRWTMQENFGFHSLALFTDDQLSRTMLADQFALVARAAAGDLDRDNEALAGELYECIQSTMELLFSNPLLSSYQIPDQFWATDLGQMFSCALIWLHRDELITLTKAAEMRGVTIQAISQAVTAGRLRRFVNPDEPNPQRRTLVSRADVGALGD